MFEQFGEHYLIDAYNVDYARAYEPDFIVGFIERVVDSTNMRKLSSINVYRVEGNGLKDSGGVTGFVVVDESHISVHTFPHRKFISADIYTCKVGTDTKAIDKAFIETFYPSQSEYVEYIENTNTQLIQRGMRFPSEDLL